MPPDIWKKIGSGRIIPRFTTRLLCLVAAKPVAKTRHPSRRSHVALRRDRDTLKSPDEFVYLNQVAQLLALHRQQRSFRILFGELVIPRFRRRIDLQSAESIGQFSRRARAELAKHIV